MADDTAREGLEGGAAARSDELEERLDEIVESGPIDGNDVPGPPRVEMHPGGPLDEMPTEDALAENSAEPGQETDGDRASMTE